MKTIPLLLILTAGLLAAFALDTPRHTGQWSMAWSNHGDPNYRGPVAIIERAPDGNTITEYPVLWRTVQITNSHAEWKSNLWMSDPNGTLQQVEFATNVAVTKAIGITNIEAPPAKALWLSSTIVTNWHEWDNSPKRIDPGFYIGDYPAPQATYGYSIGEVRSNSIINLVFNGKTNQIEQSSTILGFIRRDWKLKPAERETTERQFTQAKPFEKITELFGRPEISYVVESTNLTVWTADAMWITNRLGTNRLSLAATNIWK